MNEYTKESSCSYHVPRSWIQPRDNILVLFEEMGGNPTQISFVTREVGSVCAQVSETHPVPIELLTLDEEARKQAGPSLSLSCPFPDQVIGEIKFASFGTPHGTCGGFSHGQCSTMNALSIVEEVIVTHHF